KQVQLVAEPPREGARPRVNQGVVPCCGQRMGGGTKSAQRGTSIPGTALPAGRKSLAGARLLALRALSFVTGDTFPLRVLPRRRPQATSRSGTPVEADCGGRGQHTASPLRAEVDFRWGNQPLTLQTRYIIFISSPYNGAERPAPGP
ncbi:hypothetical protein NDU88_004232, partial [Pleurodeles waltl]